MTQGHGRNARRKPPRRTPPKVLDPALFPEKARGQVVAEQQAAIDAVASVRAKTNGRCTPKNVTGELARRAGRRR